ncbi:MAG: hypothetical protein KDC44_21365 [Phaeodactylibacter sp.]|nr:hypothetical protein [Phaeodactylibacter sp.]
MKSIQLLIPLALLLFALQAQATRTFGLGPGKLLQLLDEQEAADYIIQDRYEDLFEAIRPIDMAVQMKQPLPGNVDRANLLLQYKMFLQSEALNFTVKEENLVIKTMREAFSLCQKLNADLFPDTLRLIKIKTNHYGPSVYYTREADIMIPEDVLAAFNPREFLRVMLHELFHVYSRLNPDQQAALYQLIGFEPVTELIFPEMLDRRILLNPDGVDMRWKIDLQVDASTQLTAVPIIVSNALNYLPSKPLFFHYLQFNLYEVKEVRTGVYEVIADENGFSTLPPTIFNAYFQKIQDNTQYIIHPDEIMADNFVLAVLEEDYPKETASLSAGGKALLKQIKQQLRPAGH